MTASARQTETAHDIPLGILSGAGAGALWGLVFLAPELARDFSALDLAAGRYCAYGLIALVLVFPRLGHYRRLLTLRDWWVLAGLALFGNSFYYVMLSAAVQKGGIALTSLVIGFMPVAVTVIGSRDRHAPSLRRLFPSLALCAAGACCIGWQAVTGHDGLSRRLTGLVCALLALASWTGFAVGNSRALAAHPAISPHDWNLLTGVMTGLQAIALIPLARLTDTAAHDATRWLFLAGLSLAVAVIASLCGNALWNRMSRLLPLTMTGQMILFETAFALTYGFLWSWRWPSLPELAAFGFIVASVTSCIAAHRKPVGPAPAG